MRKKYNYIIIICMLIIGIIFIKYGFDFENKITPIYNYIVKKSDNYEVILKPNNFYTTETLPSGGVYVSNSIKDYNINLKYYFKGNKKENIESNYNIIANLVGTVKDKDNLDKEVWNRNFVLQENTKNKQNNIDEFTISKQVNIDYEYYNNLARSFEKTYNVTIEAVLKVYLNISYTINLSNLGVDNKIIEDYIELDIPITNKITKVEQNYQNDMSEDIRPKAESVKTYKIIFYIIGMLFIASAIILTIVVINKYKKTPEEIYNSKIKHILKYYDDLIVNVNAKPDLTNLKVSEVSALEDLIDIAEQSQCNIIHFQKNFYVFVNNFVYIYNTRLIK